MKWLFWKEYRQNRPIIIALLAMLIAPHLFGLYATWDDIRQNRAPDTWKRNLIGASLYSLAISQLALALIGGNAISGERADRSAEFQAYLPLTRKKILAGKLLLALAIAAIIWLANPPIIWSVFNSWDARHGASFPFLHQAIINMVITGLVFFSAAWLFSSLSSSPTFATFAGLITPLIIWSLILFALYLTFGDRWETGTGDIAQISYWSISLTVAPLCFILGTYLYLRRVEP